MSEQNIPPVTITIDDELVIAAVEPWMTPMVDVIADAASDHSDAFDNLVRQALTVAMIEGLKTAVVEYTARLGGTVNFEIPGDAAGFLAEHGE